MSGDLRDPRHQATPEEMERYYSDAGDGPLPGETMEEWQDFYARCCEQHHACLPHNQPQWKNTLRNRRKRARKARR